MTLAEPAAIQIIRAWADALKFKGYMTGIANYYHLRLKLTLNAHNVSALKRAAICEWVQLNDNRALSDMCGHLLLSAMTDMIKLENAIRAPWSGVMEYSPLPFELNVYDHWREQWDFQLSPKVTSAISQATAFYEGFAVDLLVRWMPNLASLSPVTEDTLISMGLPSSAPKIETDW